MFTPFIAQEAAHISYPQTILYIEPNHFNSLLLKDSYPRLITIQWTYLFII